SDRRGEIDVVVEGAQAELSPGRSVPLGGIGGFEVQTALGSKVGSAAPLAFVVETAEQVIRVDVPQRLHQLRGLDEPAAGALDVRQEGPRQVSGVNVGARSGKDLEVDVGEQLKVADFVAQRVQANEMGRCTRRGSIVQRLSRFSARECKHRVYVR